MVSEPVEISGSQNLFTGVRRRWKIVLLVFVLVFTATCVYTFLQRQVYEATAIIELTASSADEPGVIASNDAIATLKSRPIAAQLVQQLNPGWKSIASPPEVKVTIDRLFITGLSPVLHIHLTSPKEYMVYDSTGRFITRGVSGVPVENETIRLLLHLRGGRNGQELIVERQPVEPQIEKVLEQLKVATLGNDHKIVKITMRGDDPQHIQKAVNLLIEVYRSELLKESSRELERLDLQVAVARRSLDTAEAKLVEFKRSRGLTALSPPGERLINSVTPLEKRQTELLWQISQIKLASDRLRDAMDKSLMISAPHLEGFPQIVEAASRLSGLESRKRLLLVEFTEAHPKVAELKEDILAAQRELRSLYSHAEHELSQENQRLADKITQLEAQLNEGPDPELTRLVYDRETRAELLNFLQAKQKEVRQQKLNAASVVKVIDPAIVPVKPVQPNKAMNLALGGVLALVLGVCGALLASATDPTFKTIDDIRNTLNLPIYGVIPMIPALNKSEALPVAILSPKAPVVEAFRALRTRLHYVTGKQKHKVILVTSTLPGEGKSTLSANLSVVLSRTGAKVLLIGCDLRRPSLHDVFGESNEPGLVELLRDQKPMSVRRLQNPRFDFLPAGAVPENPSEILESQRMRQFLDLAKGLYDYVVIDAPPVLPVTDAEILAPLADVNLVVLEPCRVPGKAAAQMVRSLQDVGAKISGIVINDKTGHGFKYYGSYSYYGNRNFAGYYGESMDELQDGALEGLVKKVWGKLNS